MLKQPCSQYGVGRTKDFGAWSRRKIDPLRVDAVPICAQRGNRRRASPYSDYTLTVWDAAAGQPERKPAPFAKAYSGLTGTEMACADAVVRMTTVESFGPVRLPRRLRRRDDKPVDRADTLATLAVSSPP